MAQKEHSMTHPNKRMAIYRLKLGHLIDILPVNCLYCVTRWKTFIGIQLKLGRFIDN